MTEKPISYSNFTITRKREIKVLHNWHRHSDVINCFWGIILTIWPHSSKPLLPSDGIFPLHWHHPRNERCYLIPESCHVEIPSCKVTVMRSISDEVIQTSNFNFYTGWKIPLEFNWITNVWDITMISCNWKGPSPMKRPRHTFNNLLQLINIALYSTDRGINNSI